MDEILEIPAEWEIRDDPREALYNDYLDGVSTAYNTLRLVSLLYRDGSLPEEQYRMVAILLDPIAKRCGA